MNGSTVGTVVLNAAVDVVRSVLGQVASALLKAAVDFVSNLVEQAVAFLMDKKAPAAQAAGAGASRMTEAAVDALVGALGQAQAELMRLRGSLTVDDVRAVFSRSFAPAALGTA